jgi:sugar phosphate isomerase/epimerase
VKTDCRTGRESHTEPMTRRQFLATGAAGLVGLSSAPELLSAEAGGLRNKIIGFTKPFDTLSPEVTADLVADVGWDGVEMGIRKYRGHVQPEKVEDDLPAMVEAFKRRGKEITIATTEITEPSPLNERVLRVAAKSGIGIVRLGFFHYTKEQPLEKQLAEVGARLKDIAALCRELGLKAGFQNHSGVDMVGAGIWDAWSAIKDLSEIGFCFDIGHATIEGGLSWPTEARLTRPKFVAVYLKDFLWEKGPKKWNAKWVPLGEGMVNPDFFKWLRATNYTGPICQHHEYDHGSGDMLRKHLKDDFGTLKRWLA